MSVVTVLRSPSIRFSLALAALLGTTACGDDGNDNGDPSPTPESPGGNDTTEELDCEDDEVIDPTLLIDDMEDCTFFTVAVDGRSGGWWAASDGSAGGTMVPSPDREAPPEPLPIPRCESRYAMHVTGAGFEEWGAILGVSFVWANGGQLPYDASRHEGVTFWARIGDTSTNTVRVAFPDINSEPEGGICTDDGSLETGCFDTRGVVVTGLSQQWKRYRIPFAGASQRGFGLPTDALATDQLYGLHFFFEAGTVFDFWVDDLMFY